MKETCKSERCASGDECPAVREIGRPEKLGRHNKDHYCYRCRTRRADEATSSRERRVQGGLPRVSAS
ncbi:MAG: hypothetical protein M3R38_17690 [Actinomycetota bacterium]|nr:hypothetical protein [Actinomycetota bacterium]